MPASYMPKDDPRETSQTVDPARSIESVPPPSPSDSAFAFSDTDYQLEAVYTDHSPYPPDTHDHNAQPQPSSSGKTSVLTIIREGNGALREEDITEETDISSLEEDTVKLSSIEKMRYLSHLNQSHNSDIKDKREHEEKQPDHKDTSGEIVSPAQLARPDLVVLIPTHNSAAMLPPLLSTLQENLEGIHTEVIFVDDSNDTTPLIIKEASVTIQSSTFRIQVDHHEPDSIHTGKLTTVFEHNIHTTQTQYIAVLNIHLPHSPALLRTLYDTMVARDADLVLASRYVQANTNRTHEGIGRRLRSISTRLGMKAVFPEQLRHVSDPLSDSFLVKRSILQAVDLTTRSQQFLLEILIRSPWKRLVEVPCATPVQTQEEANANRLSTSATLHHIWQLTMEVPAAARPWKLGGLVGANVLVIAAMLFFFTYIAIPGLWETLRTVVFSVLALLNFIFINRYVFPVISASKQGQIAPSSLTVPSHEEVAQAPSQPARAFSIGKLFTRLPALVVIAATCWMIYLLPGVWVILAAFLIGLSILTHNNVNKHQTITMTLGVVVGLSAIDYVTWRFEVANWTGWWIALPLLAAEVLGALHTIGFQYTLWPRSPLPLHKTEDATQQPIFIFIPTVNEGVAILEPTLKAILEARTRYLAQYPHGRVHVVVCNDGRVANASNWQETEELASRLGVICITRTVKGGAKAGNIEHARQQLQATNDALIVIFDADQIAKPEFLLKTIPPFGDTSVGWVQTGQYYHNLENPVSRWADDQQAMFYNLLCPGKAARNAAFICGTNVVIRAKALDQIGGFPQDSVTEDFAASINLHPYWKSLYLTDVLATGLGPMDLPSYLKQQRRWAMGTLGVLRTHWRHIFLPQKQGLSIEQRIQYFLACTHYLCGVRDLIYLLGPILFILIGTPAVKGSTLDAFIWHFLPYFLSSSAALWYAGRGITGLRGIIIGFGSFPVLLQSLLSVILQRKIGFAVTSKQRRQGRAWNHLLVYIVFMLVCIVCIVLATLVKGRQQTPLFISVLWIIYSLCILGAFLRLGITDIRSQTAKEAEQTEADDFLEYPSRLLNREQGLRPVWNLALALCLASLLFSGISIPTQAAHPATFALNQRTIQQPYLGVSLPIELLQSRPPVLEQKLDAHFAIIGRTQDVNDHFDRAWADQLARQHERPWITLEFGTFEATGKPPLNANLPAIINGVDDEQLRSWANAVRDYEKPIYLTMLLHVDRNWALTSAVANGGIPQDVAPAWAHARSIFKQAGAVNVAWVWAPADLVHDQQYAPPAAMIDAVVAFLIRYPDTPWPDPKTVLTSAVTHYPTKPIIVEVSADGPAAEKATWFLKLGNATVKTPGIHALIYKEGSPNLHATLAEDNLWSLASDENCLAAMHQVASRLIQAIR